MLNKLMKYELKATSRLLGPLYLILVLMSVLNRFVINLNDNNNAANALKVFFIATYVTSIFVVFIVTVFYMIIRFYKNLLTDEGYLMFTLPAKTHELITSKLLSTVLWTIVSVVVVLFSLFLAFATPQNMPHISTGIKQFSESLNREFGGTGGLLLIEFIIMILLSLVVNVLLIYLSIAVGQLFSKHKIIGSFAAYMIIYTVLQFLAIILLIPFGIFWSNNQPQINSIPQVIFPIAIVILIVGSVCFYAATNYIFKKKLNLE